MIANLNNFNQPDTNPETNLNDGSKFESLVQVNNYFNASNLSFKKNILFRSINNNRLLIVDFNLTLNSYEAYKINRSLVDSNPSSFNATSNESFLDYLKSLEFPIFE